MRRQLSSKSNTCTESIDVDVAGISVKACEPYPGRSVYLLHEELRKPEGGRKDMQKSAEGIVKLLNRRFIVVSDRTRPLEDRERKEGTIRDRPGSGSS
jgi:hypothetical protein